MMYEKLNVKAENLPDWLRPAIGSETYDFMMRLLPQPGMREKLAAETTRRHRLQAEGKPWLTFDEEGGNTDGTKQ